ncbi:MAG: archaetidylinositol phosphate synthase [Archaeoglobi archaeon]|nr:archaetidylinositol phosphate synthase [Archaeoglobi archaeon]MDK2782264.1 archaetidylinositol phosphate synthase [Archaeoglobi archaeon]
MRAARATFNTPSEDKFLFKMLSSVKSRTTKLLRPLARFLKDFGIQPNHLTVLGLLFSLVSACFIINQRMILGAIFLLISGFMDMMDGALARTENLESDFGGFFDSVMDRYVEIIIFISLGLSGVSWFSVAAAMSGALMVSYTRARAERIIERCDVGVAERGERLLILIAGLLTGRVEEAVIIVAVLSHLTALHRILYTRKALKKRHL